MKGMKSRSQCIPIVREIPMLSGTLKWRIFYGWNWERSVSALKRSLFNSSSLLSVMFSRFELHQRLVSQMHARRADVASHVSAGE